MVIRHMYEKKLTLLHSELAEMADLVEAAIEGAAAAVAQGDIERARAVAEADAAIDDIERDIERLCLELFLRQQPVATDLRNVSAALKMITDLERIGDQAADICDIVENLGVGEMFEQPVDLPQMAVTTQSMVRSAITAYTNLDLELAHQVMERDDEVDRLFHRVRDELVSELREDGTDGERVVDLLMVAKYFERIGDHAENIAEWAEYAITGIHKGEQIALG